MVTDFFGSLLQELGPLIQIANLAPDGNNCCLIKFKDNIFVQMELARNGSDVIVGSSLGEVPVGAYRENLFKAALRANGLPSPRCGTFAYSKQKNQLVLFEIFPIKGITGAVLAEFLILFLEMVKVWKEAITRGDVPLIESLRPSGPKAGMFGLRT